MKFIKWSLVALLLGCLSAHAVDLFFVAGQAGTVSNDRQSVLAAAPAEGMPAPVFMQEAGKRPAHAIVQRKAGHALRAENADTGAKAHWARREAHVRLRQNALYAFRRAQQSGSFAASDSINHRYLTYG